jgi:hypothetical protein
MSKFPEGGILPLPGGALRAFRTAIPPGKMPGSTAGRMPAATAQIGGSVQMRPRTGGWDLVGNLLPALLK